MTLPDIFQQIYIEDLKTGTIDEITELNEFQFEASPIDELHRFNLHFGYPNTIDEENMIIYVITAYIPDVENFEDDFKTRRNNESR